VVVVLVVGFRMTVRRNSGTIVLTQGQMCASNLSFLRHSATYYVNKVRYLYIRYRTMSLWL